MSWPIKNLGQITSKNGIMVDGDWVESKDQDPQGTVRLLQLADVGGCHFVDKSSRFMTEEKALKLKCTFLEEGDILIARMPDPIGRACIFPGSSQRCVTVVDVCILRIDPKEFDNRWLMYMINSTGFHHQILEFVSGTTRQRIARKKLEMLGLECPPLEIQKQIAAVLEKADQLRKDCRLMEQELNSLAQSVFIDMFGDPVTNPKGWEVKALSEVANVVTGNTPSRAKPEYYGNHIEWIKSGNINTPSHYLTVSNEHLSEKGEAVGRSVNAGAVLMTCIAGSPECIGNVAIADRCVTFNQQINALVPKKKLLNTEFIYVLLIVGKKIIQASSTNSMKGMISKGKLEEIRLPIPPYEQQCDFSQKFKKLELIVSEYSKQVEQADEMFGSLMQKAFKGELKLGAVA